ncbi:hypothetical protein Tco_0912184 [Tanacetum coccineum]
MDFEATKAKLKRYGEELQTKTLKKQKIDDKDVPAIGEKVVEVKEEEPVKRTGKRKKQKARKGLYRLVMQKYRTNRPEMLYDFVLWSDLRTMLDSPLNEDAYLELTTSAKDGRKYPLSKDVCQVMLKMKLLNGKINEVLSKGANSLQAEGLDLFSKMIQQQLSNNDDDSIDFCSASEKKNLHQQAESKLVLSVLQAPKTAKQLAARRNQERVKSILLLAILDEYLLKFHNVADAKSL